MAMIPMVLIVEVSISFFGISYYLIEPFEEGLVLDFFPILDALVLGIQPLPLDCYLTLAALNNPFSVGYCCICPT